MTRLLLVLFCFVISNGFVRAHVVVVGPPADQISNAGAVLAGSLSKEGVYWKFQIKRVLTGSCKPGDVLTVYPGSSAILLMAEQVGSQDFLLLCHYNEESRFLVPRPYSRAFPHGQSAEEFPARTLQETIAFAEKVLGIPPSGLEVPAEWRIPVPSAPEREWITRPVPSSRIAGEAPPDWSKRAATSRVPVTAAAPPAAVRASHPGSMSAPARSDFLRGLLAGAAFTGAGLAGFLLWRGRLLQQAGSTY